MADKQEQSVQRVLKDSARLGKGITIHVGLAPLFAANRNYFEQSSAASRRIMDAGLDGLDPTDFYPSTTTRRL